MKNNTLLKLQTTFAVDETTTNLKEEVLIGENSVSKNICLNILEVKVIKVFMTTFLLQLLLIYKTDGSNASKTETYWMQTLANVALCGLNVENSI